MSIGNVILAVGILLIIVGLYCIADWYEFGLLPYDWQVAGMCVGFILGFIHVLVGLSIG